MTSDRRQFTRIPFAAPAGLLVGGIEQPVDIIDLSLKGALVRPQGELYVTIGSDGSLQVRLDEAGDCIRMDVTVVHHQGDCYGLACRGIDLDSVTHLRRLVALNLGDEALLEREIRLLLAP
jgi:hypothetical protein